MQGSEASQDVHDSFAELVRIVATLRGENGCPWDREQTHESIVKNMIEEAYEAVDAIEQGNIASLKEELGDVLLQVLLHSQIAVEAGEFSLDDVICSISNKLVYRHPHVFGNEASFEAAGLTEDEIAMIENAVDADSTLKLWDRMKLVERQRKVGLQSGSEGEGISGGAVDGADVVELESLLSSVPKCEPALMQAQDISRKAAAQGFEWEDIEGLTDKLAEELDEYSEAEPGTPEALEEFGDVLFTLVNIARWDGIDAESALRRSCEKFRQRWSAMEQLARNEGVDLIDLDYQEWDEYWNSAKAQD